MMPDSQMPQLPCLIQGMMPSGQTESKEAGLGGAGCEVGVIGVRTWSGTTSMYW